MKVGMVDVRRHHQLQPLLHRLFLVDSEIKAARPYPEEYASSIGIDPIQMNNLTADEGG